MWEQWGCPDIDARKPEGVFLPVPGSRFEFDTCPAFYLRTASGGRKAPHLIDGHTHPAQLVSEWAFEVESGSRSIETLSPKARELVHLYLTEKSAKSLYEIKLRSDRRG